MTTLGEVVDALYSTGEPMSGSGISDDEALAYAILDRLVHNAYRINLKGESMRKRTQKLTTPSTSD